ncbi:MAG: ATP synthase subunit I [Candidatus Izimaplasma sp.]|nr:ATP synthase subunit I [Candidatus Izimaplasma bacterium]
MDKRDPFLLTFPIMWAITLLVVVILWIVGQKIWGLSYALGSVTMLFTMSMLYKSSKKVLSQDKQNAQRMAVRNYAFRYFFYAVILVTAAVHDNLSVIVAAIGLFSFKVIFYIVFFVTERGESNA